MKSRHKARELAVQTLYSLDFNNKLSLDTDFELPDLEFQEEEPIEPEARIFARYLVQGTLEHLDEVDALISKYSVNRPIERIDIVDRNILRLAFFQLEYNKETHPTIIIDESVKLSQDLSNDVSFKFINGILDTYVKKGRSND